MSTSKNFPLKTSRRYTSSLLWILGVIVALQLVNWVYTSLSNNLDKRGAELRAAAVALRNDCDLLAPKTLSPIGEPPRAPTPEQYIQIGQFHYTGMSLRTDAASLLESSEILARISMVALASRLGRTGAVAKTAVEPLPAAVPSDYVTQCHADADTATHAADIAKVTAERAGLVAGVLQNFVLPVLLGTIGALAYVLRNASEQIRSRTFSSVTPLRNLVRVVLGALMGVVIGLFTDISTKASLQPLAIAFLAGYGVEPVFSLFDGLIARLK